ncbi:MAG: MFS transporter [Chloroflexota bacterium]|nr:MFS transporter [Chloroflexota bacterium]MDE2885833.1 MFS transporter [Chloroflexota bacterium]
MAGRFSALRYRDFRLFWVGFVIAVSGQQMQWMIEGWLIYQLSGNPWLLGVHGIAQMVPSTALTLYGGALADRFDQRKLLITVQFLFIMALGTLSGLGIAGMLTAWHVIVGGFVLSAIGSFEGPARQAMFPHLVARESMPSAVGLNAMIHPATRVGSPVVGGLISRFVLDASDSASVAGGVVFAVTAAAVAVYAALLWRVHLPAVVRARGRSVLADMAAAVGYIRREKVFMFLIGTAYWNMAFGVSLAVLFPIFAEDILGVGPDGLGYMWGAMGVGSVAGVFIASSLTSPNQQRTLLVGGAVTMGVFMVAFGLSQWYEVSLVLLFAYGMGASMLNVGVQTNLQMLVANEFRGRVMGIWSMVHTSVRPMGELQFAGVAAVATAPIAATAGAVAVLAFALGYGWRSTQMIRLQDLRAGAQAREEG